MGFHQTCSVVSSEPVQHNVNIVLLGDARVGKTSLVRQYIKPDEYQFDEEFCDDDYDPTLEDEYTRQLVLDGRHPVRLSVMDTMGLDGGCDSSDLLSQYVTASGAQGFLVVFSLDDWSSYLAAAKLCSAIRWKTSSPLSGGLRSAGGELAGSEMVPIVLVGNKTDLPAGRREVTREEGLALAESQSVCGYFETSTRHLLPGSMPSMAGVPFEALTRAILRIPPQSPPAQLNASAHRESLTLRVGRILASRLKIDHAVDQSSGLSHCCRTWRSLWRSRVMQKDHHKETVKDKDSIDTSNGSHSSHALVISKFDPAYQLYNQSVSVMNCLHEVRTKPLIHCNPLYQSATSLTDSTLQQLQLPADLYSETDLMIPTKSLPPSPAAVLLCDTSGEPSPTTHPNNVTAQSLQKNEKIFTFDEAVIQSSSAALLHSNKTDQDVGRARRSAARPWTRLFTSCCTPVDEGDLPLSREKEMPISWHNDPAQSECDAYDVPQPEMNSSNEASLKQNLLSFVTQPDVTQLLTKSCDMTQPSPGLRLKLNDFFSRFSKRSCRSPAAGSRQQIITIVGSSQ